MSLIRGGREAQEMPRILLEPYRGASKACLSSIFSDAGVDALEDTLDGAGVDALEDALDGAAAALRFSFARLLF